MSDTLTPALKRGPEKYAAYLARTTELYSLRSETYAKSKAPWTDRTGNARSGLSSTWRADIGSSGAKFEIDIFHRVPYGVFLELRWGGRWSIISKTVAAQGPKFFKTANQVFAKMFGGS